MKRPSLFTGNEEIEKYADDLEISGMSEITITQNLWKLSLFFKFIGHANPNAITKDDIDKYIKALRTDVKAGKKKESTVKQHILTLRSFFNWKFPVNEWFDRIKIKPTALCDPNKEWATREDVLKMIKECTSQRDRALILLLWESGCRVSEIIGLNRKDVKPDKYGATIIVTGKTGTRKIRLCDSVPDIQLYLNQTDGKPDDPLFPTDRTGRLTVRGVQNALLRLSNRAGIDPHKTHPHSLRHGRLTELSNHGISEMLLRNFAGWQSTSKMPAVYINPTERDLDNKLCELAGVKVEEESKPDMSSTHTSVCPRCRTLNPFDSKYCRTCSLVLDPVEAMSIEQANNEFNDLLVKTLISNPEFGKALADEIAKQQLNKN